MFSFPRLSLQVPVRAVVCLVTLAALTACSIPVARSDDGLGDRNTHSRDAAKDAALQEAVVHVIMGLDAYSARDFAGTLEELDTAVKATLEAGIARTRRGALRTLGEQLPPGYSDYNLVKVYRDAGRHADEAPTYAEQVREGDSASEIGVPQGMGQERSGAEEGAGEETEPPAGLESSTLSPDDIAFVRQEIGRILEAFGETEYPNSEIFEERVLRFIELYQTDLSGFFRRSMIRSAKYLPMVQEILGEKGVPGVMAYIAFVESGFRPGAVSRAGAVGLWQFMPSTARAYGLKVSRGLDERKDPVKSTLAAREYFLDLVAIFGSRSFLLAMASYNAGEGKVQYCLKQVEDPFTQRTFWDIAPCLRKETREYIPRVIAAAIVAQDAERFGFGDAAVYLDPERYTVVELDFPVPLDTLAGACGITVDELRAMNLDIRSGRQTTPDMRPYWLLIPADRQRKVTKMLDRIAKQREEARVAAAKESRASAQGKTTGRKEAGGHAARGSSSRSGGGHASKEKTKYVKYRVQPGNTLSVIAEDFGTSVAKLKEWNPYLRKRGLQAGDTLFIYDLDWSYRKWRHTIVAGDTLGGIAHTYGVSVDEIRRWNGLKGDVIHAGKRLVIYTHGKATQIAERNLGTSGGGRRPVTYVVQKGNNLSMIAAMFDVNFRDIMAWNNLSSGRIYPGQKLIIYPGEDLVAQRYRVKRGDTLIGIAHRFKVDPAYLAAVNGLTDADHLEAGQVLIVYRKK